MAFRLRGDPLSWFFAALAVLGLFVLALGALVVRRGNATALTFGDIDDLGGEILGHVGAYLLPALVESQTSTEQGVIAGMILLLIVHIHVATGRIYVNPLLYLLKRRVYSATVGSTTYYLVAKSDVADWKTPKPCVQVGSNLLIESSK